MSALRDRSTAVRTADRALAAITGALDHRPDEGTGRDATSDASVDPIPTPKCPAERTAHPARPPRAPRGGLDHEPLTSADDPSDDLVGRKVRAERQRIAAALHDDVSQLLFAMAARARRAGELHAGDPEALGATLATLTEQLHQAQDRLRAVIHACGPTSAADTIPVATQRDLDDFSGRTGIATHLLVQGRPAHLPPAIERVALNCLRQGLFNVERHAGADVVVVTLDYRPDRLRLVVQDDGRGLPEGFEPRAVPSDGHNWGFTSMAEQVQRLGGAVLLRRVPDSDGDGGGTQLRVDLPRLSERPTRERPTHERPAHERPARERTSRTEARERTSRAETR